MALDIIIHEAQTSILRELLFHPQAGYAELQKPTGLSSNHFNFHISRLVELDLVEKVIRGMYRLTPRGKEFANRLDTDNNTIERQQKTAVILALRRQTNAVTEYLFQERLKNPYFGFWGLLTGKVRWGETIVQTAARESLEETGLKADFAVTGVYHELVRKSENTEKSEELLEDKIFFLVVGSNLRGQLQVDFEGGHNEWLTFDDFIQKPKKFDSHQAQQSILLGEQWFVERNTTYSKEHF